MSKSRFQYVDELIMDFCSAIAGVFMYIGNTNVIASKILYAKESTKALKGFETIPGPPCKKHW